MLVIVRRPYGGAEGNRVRPGQRFWVMTPGAKKAPADVDAVISHTRYLSLKERGMVSPPAEGEKPARPKPKVQPAPRRPASPAPRKTKVDPDPVDRAAQERAKAKGGDTNTKADRPPNGGQTGEGEQSSLSPADPASPPSTLKQRGTKRGQKRGGSPSTTPTPAQNGPTSSMDATANGGDTTTESEDSAAFA